MATKIQVRRDTAANWLSVDPTLSTGEFGYETNTGKLKIGNGTTKWSLLAYYTSPHASTHAVGGSDYIFPANPGSDKFLMWDDSEGEIIWGDAITSVAMSDLTDVDLTDIADGKILKYNSGTSKWECEDESGVEAWTIVTDDTSVSVTNGYITNSTNTIKITLPATAAAGDYVKVAGRDTEGWMVVPSSGDSLYAGQFLSPFASESNFGGATIRVIEANAKWIVDAQYSCAPYRYRGIFMGGQNAAWDTYYDTIDYILINTNGNAVDFGDLTVARSWGAACGGVMRGAYAGGYTGSVYNTIDYITISTTSNASDFGDTSANCYQGAGSGGLYRGIIELGYTSAAVDTIEYITFSILSNSIDFGDMTVVASSRACASDYKRVAFYAGDTGGSRTNIIDYITISTTGNATDWGDSFSEVAYAAGVGNSLRGLFFGGLTAAPLTVTDIGYITWATAGNAADFGDISTSLLGPPGERAGAAACGDEIKAITGGGTYSWYPSGYYDVDVVMYVDYATTGNTADFGQLTQSRFNCSAISS